MKITDDLERLAHLHRQGGLTDDEFAKAKKKLLSYATPTEPENYRDYSRRNTLGDAAKLYVTFQILSAIVGGIILLTFVVYFVLPHFVGQPGQVFVIQPK